MIILNMEANIKANKSIAEFHTEGNYQLPTIGGFEMTSNGESCQFDFADGEYYVHDEDNSITCCLKNPDLSCFPKMEDFIKNKLYRKIEKIDDFYIDDDVDNDLSFTVLDVTFIEFDTETLSDNYIKYSVPADVITAYNVNRQSE